MPNYDYHCDNCGKTIEAFQKITEEPLKNCPHCKENSLRRGVGGGNTLFRFKGSGFYLTDYCQKESSPSQSSSSSNACACKGKHSC